MVNDREAVDGRIALSVMSLRSTLCSSDVSGRQLSFCKPDDILERCINNTNYGPMNPILTTPPPALGDSLHLLVVTPCHDTARLDRLHCEGAGRIPSPPHSPVPYCMIVSAAQSKPRVCNLDRKDRDAVVGYRHVIPFRERRAQSRAP
jgi:hypothetical protein